MRVQKGAINSPPRRANRDRSADRPVLKNILTLFVGRRIVFYFAVALGEPGANFLGIILERAIPTLVRDVPGFVDDVKALRPGGVGIVGGVVHFIDSERYRIFKALGEIVGDGDAVAQTLGLHVANVILVLFVGLHAPFVEWMSFADVDGQEIGVFLVVAVELNDVANLATEGWSGEAAEDEDERSASSFFANMEVRGAVEGDQTRIRSLISHFQRAAMHVRKGVVHHMNGVFRAAGHDAKKDEHSRDESG